MHERPTWLSLGPPWGLLGARCRPFWGSLRARALQRGLSGPQQGSKRSQEPVTNKVFCDRSFDPEVLLASSWGPPGAFQGLPVRFRRASRGPKMAPDGCYNAPRVVASIGCLLGALLGQSWGPIGA
eukprot:3909075-Pyramimonas_sp.AAC.1